MGLSGMTMEKLSRVELKLGEMKVRIKRSRAKKQQLLVYTNRRQQQQQ